MIAMQQLRRLMAASGWARSQRATLFVLAFGLLEILSGVAITANFSKTRQRYFAKELEQLQVAYQAICNTYEHTARLLFNEITAHPEFHDSLPDLPSAPALPSAEAVEDEARQRVLTILRPYYHRVLDQHVDALEFHLPNGVNLVRVQHPSRHGDAVFEARSAVRRAGELHLAVKGFESSAHETGFRYLFPVHAGGVLRGVLEIGIAIDGIRDELETLFMREFLFLLKQPPDGAFSGSSPRAASRLSAAYLRDETNIFIHAGAAAITAIDDAIGPTVAERLAREAAFVTTARVQRQDFLVTFLPVFDIERRHVAFFVSYKEDAAIREYRRERLLLMLGASVGNVALWATIYLLRRSRLRIAWDERRFELITDSMHEGVCVVDREQRVTFVNRAGMQMFACARADILGVHVSDLMRYQVAAGPARQGRECPVHQALARAQRYTSDQYAALTTIGQTVPVELTSAPMLQERAWVGSVVVMRDITQRKQADAQLQQMNRQLQEASRHKSEFLSRMSHELRTPLNATIGYLTLTLNDARQTGDQSLAQNLIKAERSARTLLELINDVLDFSKIEAGHMETFVEEVDLAEVLDDVATTAEGLLLNKAVRSNIELAGELPMLRTDYTKLTQILNNLIGNAVKFTTRGAVTVRAGARSDGPGVRIEVEDTGCGIPADKLGTIFESFKQGDDSTTRKFGGTGLGLAITKKFCDMLGIVIGVRSVVDQGSLFWLHVPLACDPSAASEHPPLPDARGAERPARYGTGADDADGGRARVVEDVIFPRERAIYEAVYPRHAALLRRRDNL